MTSETPRLLSGGNPQVPKGDGDAPVAAWLAAVPGWKQAACRRIDTLIVETVPGVRKQVRWNTPFYGAGPDGWFLGTHCLTHYVKVAFLNGAAFDPPPPEPSKQPKARYWHAREGDEIGVQFLDWARQASALPGEKL